MRGVERPNAGSGEAHRKRPFLHSQVRSSPTAPLRFSEPAQPFETVLSLNRARKSRTNPWVSPLTAKMEAVQRSSLRAGGFGNKFWKLLLNQNPIVALELGSWIRNGQGAAVASNFLQGLPVRRT